MVDVGVVVDFTTTVIGIVTAYELVLTDVDLAPYFVVQSFAVEYSYASAGKKYTERAAKTKGMYIMLRKIFNLHAGASLSEDRGKTRRNCRP